MWRPLWVSVNSRAAAAVKEMQHMLRCEEDEAADEESDKKNRDNRQMNKTCVFVNKEKLCSIIKHRKLHQEQTSPQELAFPLILH